MYDLSDTIAALGTCAPLPGEAGAAIIRISGNDTLPILKILGLNIPPKPGILYPVSCNLDEVTAGLTILYFSHGKSYTGQEMAEIHLLEPMPVVERVLERICRTARPAGPGEFTLRAYLLGKIDLTQAEAVARLVASASRVHLRAARELISGKLGAAVETLRNDILNLVSLIESGLDFSTEEIEFISPGHAAEQIDAFLGQIDAILDGPVQQQRNLNLPCTAMVGPTNAGKSTLMNSLSGRQRSIVSGTIATTRDILSEVIRLEHLSCVLLDCAGIAGKFSPDDVAFSQLDHRAAALAQAALEQSDLVLLCIPPASRIQTDYDALEGWIKEKPFFLLRTQCDLADAAGLESEPRFQSLCEKAQRVLSVSVKAKTGIEELKNALNHALVKLQEAGPAHNPFGAVNDRHRESLAAARENCLLAKAELANHVEEAAAMYLSQAAARLGGIGHENLTEDVLGRIFSRFCIGK